MQWGFTGWMGIMGLSSLALAQTGVRMLAPQYSWTIDKRLHVEEVDASAALIRATTLPPHTAGQPPHWPLLTGWQVSPSGGDAESTWHTSVQWLLGAGYSEASRPGPVAAGWTMVLSDFNWPTTPQPTDGVALGWLPDVDKAGLTPLSATAVSVPMLRLSRCVVVTGRWPASTAATSGPGPRIPVAGQQTALIQGLAIRPDPGQIPITPTHFALRQEDSALTLQWHDDEGRSPAYQWLVRYCLL